MYTSIFLQTSDISEKYQLLCGLYEFYCTFIFKSQVVEEFVMVFDVLLPTLTPVDTLPQAKLYVVCGNSTIMHTQINLINIKNINGYIPTVVLLKVHKLVRAEVVSKGLLFPAHNAVM
jgi:hypothetical protein